VRNTLDFWNDLELRRLIREAEALIVGDRERVDF
jgi:hypothetical protein